MEFTKKQKELLKQCKYYHGEDKCPQNTDFFFWEAEMVWIEKQDYKTDSKFFNDNEEKIRKKYPDIPLSLLACIYDLCEHFNTYSMSPYDSYKVTGLDEFYRNVNDYIASTSM